MSNSLTMRLFPINLPYFQHSASFVSWINGTNKEVVVSQSFLLPLDGDPFKNKGVRCSETEEEAG